MKSVQRVWLTPAYLLHQYSYRDSSRIAEVFTREHGRVSLFARGIRTPKSPLRACLRPFQRLLVSWVGKSDAGQLTAAEIDGGVTQLPPARLMSGFYLNELLLKLTERWDAHSGLFDHYDATVAALAGGAEEAPQLRRFEKRLLEELGYGMDFTRTDQGEPIHPELHYCVKAQQAVSRCAADVPDAVIGRSLLDLDNELFLELDTLRTAKRILRASLDLCLDGRPLGSRVVMMALHRQEQA